MKTNKRYSRHGPGRLINRWSPLEPDDINPLWIDYQSARASGDGTTLRNKIAGKYIPFVESLALSVYYGLSREVDFEDLVSGGVFGLMDAVDSFDLTRGVKFETYATPRIRGAMMDELRRTDRVRRLSRQRITLFESTRNRLQTERSERISDSEVEAELRRISRENADKVIAEGGEEYKKFRKRLEHEAGGSVSARELNKEIRRLYQEHANRIIRDYVTRGRAPKSLDELQEYSDIHADSKLKDNYDFEEDKKAEDPAEGLTALDNLRVLTKGLNKTEALLLILYYYEDLPMKEVGKHLPKNKRDGSDNGLTESRVSQMHESIIERLQASPTVRRHFQIRSEE